MTPKTWPIAIPSKQGTVTAGRKVCLPGILTFAVLLAMTCGQARPAFALTVVPANAIYVDLTLTHAHVTTYNPATRAATGGTSSAYNTLTAAATAAVAGNTVVLRAGSYGTALSPANSGTPGQPITFAAYPGEAPVITGSTLAPAIEISNLSWVVLDSLTVNNVNRWLYAFSSSNVVITNCQFTNALNPGGSQFGGVYLQQATFCVITGNLFETSTEDNFSLILSNQNVIEGNTFTYAGHTLWTVKGGSFNIFRNNYFYNADQKIGETLDCDGVGAVNAQGAIIDDPGYVNVLFEQNCTKRNLYEGNVFAYTPSSGNTAWFAGIQYAGQQGIIRRNVFYNEVGAALDLTAYGGEAQYCTENRVYNNDMDRSSIAGVSLAGYSGVSGYEFSGNLLVNNILTGSVFVANDTRWTWYTKVLAGMPVQVIDGLPSGFVFQNNNLFYQQAGQIGIIVDGEAGNTPTQQQTLQNVAWFETNQPQLFYSNQELNPQYVNPTGAGTPTGPGASAPDYHLQAGSPMISAGAFLTQVTGSGTNTTLPVQDVLWFFDGYGIPGEVGDVIRLQGQSQTARILSINYASEQLTLDTPLTFTAGQGVALAYNAAAPDMGALPFQSTPSYTLNVVSTPLTGVAITGTYAGTTNYRAAGIASGASITVTAPATDSAGDAFFEWTVNGVPQTAGQLGVTITMPASDATAVAVYVGALWTLQIQAPTGGSTTGTTPGTGSYTYSVGASSASVTANPAAGQVFSHWTGTAVTGQPTTNPITIPSGTAGQTLTLQPVFATTWNLQILAPQGSGTTSMAPGTYSYSAGSASPSITATPSSGWVFAYWTGTAAPGQQVTNPFAVPNGDATHSQGGPQTVTLQPVFVQQWTLQIQVPSGSGTTSPGVASYTYTVGAFSNPVTAVPQSGYVLSHWTGTAVSGSPTTNPITISTGTAGQTLTLQAVFGQSYALNVQSTPPTGLTIGSSTSDGGTTNYAASSVSGANVNLSAPATDPTGYTFSKWALNGTSQTAGMKAITFSMPAAAETAVATYTTNTYALTVQSTPPTGEAIVSSTGDGGTSNYSISSVSYGASVNLSAPAADPTGYTFSKWTLNSVAQTAGTKAITFSMPASAETAVATYTTNAYSLTLQSTPPTGLAIGSTAGDGGTTNYSVSSVSYGASVNLSAPATDPTGYTFSKWTLNSVAQTAGTKAITFSMPANAETAVATYTTNTYALTVQSTPPTGLGIGSTTADGGTTNYSISSVSYGASVNLSAPATDPSGDYSFANWSLNGVNQTAGQMALTFSMPAGAETAVATYAANAYALTVQSSGPTGVAIGSSTGDGGTSDYTLSAVAYGTTVDLSAPATDPAGYLFEQWTLNGVSQTALQKDLTFPMPAGAETAVATYAPAVTLTVQSTPIAGVAISSANGHGGTTNYTLSPLASGTTVTLTAPTNDPPGYVFSLWLLNGRPQPASRRTVSFSMNASTTAVASYAPITLAVQSSSVAGVAISSVNGHGGTTNYTLSPIVSGTTITLTAPTNDPPGYVFSLWTLNGSPQPAAKKTVSFTMKGTTTAMASYSPITLAVQSSPVTGVAITGTYPGTTDYDQSPIVSRTSVTLTAPAADPAGYVFSNWTINGTAQTAGVKTQTIVVRGTTTAVAEYTVETFALGVQSTPPTGLAIGSTSGQGGTTNYSLASVPYGTSVNLSAPASDPSGAYTFASWTLNGLGQTAGQSQLTFTMPASAETAVAVYQQIESGVMEGAQAKPVSEAQTTPAGAVVGAAIPLTVQTTPGTGVLIGSPTGQGGTSNYTVPLPASGLQVTLTAPASDPAGRPFWQWMINGAAQPPGRQTATFAVGSATTAVAVYVPSTGSGAVIGSPKSLLATPKR